MNLIMDPGKRMPDCCLTRPQATFAEHLYAAYNASGDRVTAGLSYRGEPCPTWDQLPDNVKAKWNGVADRALCAGGVHHDLGHLEFKSRNCLTFGEAISALKFGKRVRRAGWNGKGMWLALTEGTVIPGSAVAVPDGMSTALVPGPTLRGAARILALAECPNEIRIGAHIDMRAADGSLVIGWLASQTDMLAEDWEIIE